MITKYNAICDEIINKIKKEVINRGILNLDTTINCAIDIIHKHWCEDSDKMEKLFCENDCEYICAGCNKSFHEIQKECNLKCNEELPEAYYTNSDENYCHVDCFMDGQ